MKQEEASTSEEKPIDSELYSELLKSDAGMIASHVFGQESLNTIFAPSLLFVEINQKTILQNTNFYIHRILDAIEPSVAAFNEDIRPGRLGILQVRFDNTAQVGTLLMSPDRLHVRAQTNFSTVKANVCLYSGKWQYELQLESKGVMQLGWSMAQGEFSPETGVGDTVFSYAYDGNRVRKWNLMTSEYGEPWQFGDVIGCTIDLDLGNIHFYRNGRDLGEAFSHIPLGPGCAYYPAISLAYDEKLQANFGSVPFTYPIEPYLPVQQPPTGAVLRANQILCWCRRISDIPSTSSFKVKIDNELRKKQSFAAAVMLFNDVLISHLANLLGNTYVICACLVPFLHNVGLPGTSGKSSQKMTRDFCESLRILLEPDDFKEIIQTISKCLIRQFNQTSDSLDYRTQITVLETLIDICQTKTWKTALMNQHGFLKTSVPVLMDLKPIDTEALKQIVNQSWWNSGESRTKESEERKQNYLKLCSFISIKTEDVEMVQERWLEQLLENSGDFHSNITPRVRFLHTFRLFLKDNHVHGLVSFLWNNQNIEPTPLPTALSFFNCLLSVVMRLCQETAMTNPHVPLSIFTEGSVDYFSLDRLGGVLSHLLTTYHEPLINYLHSVGADEFPPLPEPPTLPTQPGAVQIQVREVDTSTGQITASVTRWISMGTLQQNAEPSTEVPYRFLDHETSLMELLDGIILLYHIAAHKQLYKISTLRDDMDKYIKTISEAKKRLVLAQENCPEAAAEIETSIKTMEKKVDEQSRVVMAWVQGNIFTGIKRSYLIWLLGVILDTLEKASQQGDLFRFVPDFYIDTMVEICTALRNYFSPTLPIDEVHDITHYLMRIAEFLVEHVSDPRVVNVSSKDTMIEALAGFVTKKLTLRCLEDLHWRSQDKFILLLLKPYDSRPWGQTNWILMRMWQGCGFAFRYQKSPHLTTKLGPRTPSSESGLLIQQSFEPCPSVKYQRIIAKHLYQHEETTVEFLNSVLKQLNWSFSEFISMMQEIQNLSKRPERVIIDARQLKICATCFDFVISLLRVVEMVCVICLPVFTDLTREGTENLLERLSQLLSQILLRVTSPTGCFMHVISLEVPDLDSIDQFPVLSAVVSVIVALLADDLKEPENPTMSAAIKSLIYEPAFQLNTLKYVLGEMQTGSAKQEAFSLANYPEAVSTTELETVQKVIDLLAKYQNRLSEASEIDEEELCPICCAMPLAATFMPCHHRSCKSCITHHLMDCKDCFFCKTAIKTVIDSEGKLLFDCAASAHKIAEMKQTAL